MNIIELAKNGANVSVNVSLSDLKEFVAELVAEVATTPQAAKETYLSVDEVCSMLHVSSNTLWRWNRSGYLQSTKVGRTPMYRLSDIENLRQPKDA